SRERSTGGQRKRAGTGSVGPLAAPVLPVREDGGEGGDRHPAHALRVHRQGARRGERPLLRRRGLPRPAHRRVPLDPPPPVSTAPLVVGRPQKATPVPAFLSPKASVLNNRLRLVDPTGREDEDAAARAERQAAAPTVAATGSSARAATVDTVCAPRSRESGAP